jgi:hypothetical protein
LPPAAAHAAGVLTLQTPERQQAPFWSQMAGQGEPWKNAPLHAEGVVTGVHAPVGRQHAPVWACEAAVAISSATPPATIERNERQHKSARVISKPP